MSKFPELVCGLSSEPVFRTRYNMYLRNENDEHGRCINCGCLEGSHFGMHHDCPTRAEKIKEKKLKIK